jgi:hypothetical protein
MVNKTFAMKPRCRRERLQDVSRYCAVVSLGKPGGAYLVGPRSAERASCGFAKAVFRTAKPSSVVSQPVQ